MRNPAFCHKHFYKKIELANREQQIENIELYRYNITLS